MARIAGADGWRDGRMTRRTDGATDGCRRPTRMPLRAFSLKAPQARATNGTYSPKTCTVPAHKGHAVKLTLKHLAYAYPTSRAGKNVLQDVSFTYETPDILSILGPNGTGKSTLLQCIMGFFKPHTGSILLDDKPLHTYTQKEIARHIAYIPQDHTPAFSYSVEDVVSMGRTPYLKAWEMPCLLYTSPSPRDRTRSRMPSSA